MAYVLSVLLEIYELFTKCEICRAKSHTLSFYSQGYDFGGEG